MKIGKEEMLAHLDNYSKSMAQAFIFDNQFNEMFNGGSIFETPCNKVFSAYDTLIWMMFCDTLEDGNDFLHDDYAIEWFFNKVWDENFDIKTIYDEWDKTQG